MILSMSLMLNRSIRFSFLCISFVLALVLGMVVTHSTGYITLPALAQQKKQVTLTAMVVDNSGGNPSEDQRARLFQPAFQELKARHPDMDININYVQSPYNQTRTHILNALGNQTPVD